MKIKYNENWQIIKTVTIYTTREDYEFELTEQEATSVINQFLDWRFIKIVYTDWTYYINVQQVINIDVE